MASLSLRFSNAVLVDAIKVPSPEPAGLQNPQKQQQQSGTSKSLQTPEPAGPRNPPQQQRVTPTLLELHPGASAAAIPTLALPHKLLKQTVTQIL